MSQTKAQLIDPVDGTIVNADINASAAIDVSKLSGVLPLAGGTLVGNLAITREQPIISFNDSTDNPDYYIGNIDGSFRVRDTTNNSNRLLIDSSGNVGIGTTPETLLHAKVNTFSDDINKVALTLSNNQSSGVHQYFQNASTGTGVSNGVRIGLGNTDNFLIQHLEAKDIQISTNGTERMRINSSGNVGIGTSSPVRNLHIKDTSPRIMLSNDNTGHASGDGTELMLDTGGNFEILQRENLNLEFFTNNLQRMTILGDGKVGIGTTSPSAGLHVSTTVQGLDVETSNAVVAEFKGSGGAGGYLAFQMGDNGANIGYLGDSGQLVSTGGANDNLALRADNGLELAVGVTRKVRIDTDGLKFGTDTAAANALSDYEEGTFTPTLPNGTSLTNSGAYYTKIGRFVNFYCYITALNIPNNSSQFRIGGLPFTVLNGMYGGPSSISYTGSANDSRIAALAPNTQTNDTYIYFHTTGIGEAFILTNAHFQVMNSGNLNVQGCYMTAQ